MGCTKFKCTKNGICTISALHTSSSPNSVILHFRTLRLHSGRPDGGEGGNGGGVVFVADSSMRSLNSLTTNYRGGDGEHGWSAFHAGRGGANIVVKVTLIMSYIYFHIGEFCK